MKALTFDIGRVVSSEDLADAAGLFRAYAASIGVDLAFQDFEAELAELPGKYAPPGGALLLARDQSGMAIGCVALRPMTTAHCCEMKRLFVATRGRGLGIGQALAEAIIVEAASLGYREIKLDTLPDMAQAISLYRTLGFMPTEPYYETPVAGTIFLARSLAP